MAAGPPVPAAAAAPGLTTPSTIQKTAPGWENTMAVKDGKVSLLLLVLQPPSIQKAAPGWENTMAVKDGKVSKLRPKTP